MNILQSPASKEIPEKKAVPEPVIGSSDNNNRKSVTFKDVKQPGMTIDYESLEQNLPSTRRNNHYCGESHKEKFMRRLLDDKNSDKLISCFSAEPSYLKSSDAHDTDFTLEACMHRVKRGYTLIGFNYNTARVHEVRISLAETYLLCQFESKFKLKVKFADIRGVIFRGLSSTFKFYASRRGNLSTLGLDDSDAFSIVTHNRTVDLASTSEVIKYDVSIVASWIAAQNPHGSVPFNKFALTAFKVRRKIHEMAEERGLFFKDLFLLAIVKTLVVRRESQDRIETVKHILDRRFNSPYKLYRICKLYKPINFVSRPLAEKEKEDKRRIVLIARRRENFTMKQRVADIYRKIYLFSIKFKLTTKRLTRYSQVLRAELPE